MPIALVALLCVPFTLAQGGAGLHKSLILLLWMLIYATLLVVITVPLFRITTPLHSKVFLRRLIIGFAMCAMYVISVYFWDLLASTSLCIGRNNGDGFDTLESCTGFLVIGASFYSLLVFPVIAFACCKIVDTELGIERKLG